MASLFYVILPVFALLLVRYLTSKDQISPPGSGEMFDSIAPYYDMMNKVISLGMDMSWRQSLIKKLNIQKDDKILDLATGTADLAILLGTELKKIPSYTGYIVGVDPSKNMLLQGNEKLIIQKLSNTVHLKRGDAQNLDMFENNTFDKVCISFGIRNVPDRSKALREMRRVIRSDSKSSILAILEFSQPNTGFLASIANTFINYIIPAIGLVVGAASEYSHLSSSISDFPSPESFNVMILNAGFSNCHYHDLFFDIVYLYVCQPTHDDNS